MHIIEILYCLVITLALISVLLSSKFAALRPGYLLFAGLLLFILGVFELGLRWQYLPASLALILVALASLRRTPVKIAWKALGTFSISLLLALSIFLGSQLPVFAPPEPEGPYAVGTFGSFLQDESRVERFNPTRKRELFVEVWYPADKQGPRGKANRTLWQELYSGDKDLVSFLSSYLRNIETHSEIEAPVAMNQQFPVLVFNHGQFTLTSQNTLLMEHLASNGYVILSLAHPFQSLKVNLEGAGTVLARFDWPNDSELDVSAPSPGIVKTGISELVGTPVSKRYEALHLLLDDFKTAENEATRREVVAQANLHSEELKLAPNYPDEYLYNYLVAEWFGPPAAVQYWVEDIAFVVDNLKSIDAPIDGFLDSLDADNLGVFGMSFGGAAAGEFCKQDARCLAGSNMDGFQFGENWKAPVLSPFLLIYSHELRGNSDWAYLANESDFHIFSIEGTSHGNLTDFPYFLPVLKTLGVSGSIDAKRGLDIINHLQLAFFDHYLKGLPLARDFDSRFPELNRRTLHQ